MRRPSSGRPQGRASTELLRSFSVDHAARVTGLSKLRLARWDRMGLFSPELIDEEDRGNPYARVYSFADLVGLQTLALLVGKYRVPIREIRTAYRELVKRAKNPWSELPLSVCKRQIVFDLDGEPRNASDGQRVLKHIPLPAIADEVARRTNELRKRQPAQIAKVEQRKFVAHNAPVIAGTRIPVRAVESFIAEGYADADIIAEYPMLKRADLTMVRRRMGTSA